MPMPEPLEPGRYKITGRVIAMKSYLGKDENRRPVMQHFLLIKDLAGRRFWVQRKTGEDICLFDKVSVTAHWWVKPEDPTFAKGGLPIIEVHPTH